MPVRHLWWANSNYDLAEVATLQQTPWVNSKYSTFYTHNAFIRRMSLLKMAKIYNLANEVLASIFKHLKGLDLGTVAKTCQRFRSAAYIDQIWQHLCERGKYLYICLFYGIKRKVVRLIRSYVNGYSQRSGQSQIQNCYI